MAVEKSGLVLRCQWEAYMECGGPEGTNHLIGEGFTSFPESKNPKEYARKYVNDKTERTDVIGYAPSIEYSADCISDDPVVKEIAKIHDGELTGTATHRKVTMVNRWEESGDTCPAVQRTFAIIPGTKGEGTDALVYTGTMKAVSDLVPGTFTLSTKTFAPTGAAAASVLSADTAPSNPKK